MERKRTLSEKLLNGILKHVSFEYQLNYSLAFVFVPLGFKSLYCEAQPQAIYCIELESFL
jgi:hypothetical protein